MSKGEFTIWTPRPNSVLNALIVIAVVAFQPSIGLCQPQQSPSKVVSNLKEDETVQFFRTAGYYVPESEEWHLPIHAWVYEPESSTVRMAVFKKVLEYKYGLEVDAASSDRFERRVNLLIADNERGKRVVIKIAGETHLLPETDPRGHAKGVVRLPPEVVENFRSKDLLPYSLVTRAEDDQAIKGEVLLVPPEGVSVVSDIDDTVKITGVTSDKDLMDYTFYQPFKAVPGMAELYQDFADREMSVHFVSSSPWQLYSPLNSFLLDSGFPPASFNLKTVRFRDFSLLNLFKPGDVTKPPTVEAILNKYPERKFLLIGDSGEQDPEVYHLIAKNHSNQVLAVFIRDVTDQETLDERYAPILADLGPDRFFIFDEPAEVRAVLVEKKLMAAKPLALD